MHSLERTPIDKREREREVIERESSVLKSKNMKKGKERKRLNLIIESETCIPTHLLDSIKDSPSMLDQEHDYLRRRMARPRMDWDGGLYHSRDDDPLAESRVKEGVERGMVVCEGHCADGW